MATTRQIVAAELFHLPHNQRYDLIQGVLHTMPFAGGQQGYITADLGAAIGKHVAENDLGIVFAAETGFVLARDPDTVMGPDVGFLRADRIPRSAPTWDFVPVAPDLVVECLPGSEYRSELMMKVNVYLAAEVSMVWLVDLDALQVTVFRPQQAPEVVTRDGIIEGGDVLPGFALPLKELFADD